MDKTIDLMKGLEVNEERMLANVGMTHGLIFAENVSLALTPAYGKLQAHELVEKACKQSIKQGKSLQEVLATMDLPIADLDRLFVPKNSIGNSLSTIDEILQSYENTL
jgi:3-carboxy-cis,cis-muconate cycloisomerase